MYNKKIKKTPDTVAESAIRPCLNHTSLSFLKKIREHTAYREAVLPPGDSHHHHAGGSQVLSDVGADAGAGARDHGDATYEPLHSKQQTESSRRRALYLSLFGCVPPGDGM